MRSRFARALALGTALVAVLLLATGCENPADPHAASVDGTSISRDDVLAEATAFGKAIEAMPDDLVNGDPDPFLVTDELDHSLATVEVSDVLGSMITAAVFEHAAERMGLQVEQSDIDSARAGFDPATYSAWPSDLLDTLVRRTAVSAVVQNHVAAGEWWTDDDIARYYEQTKRRACVHHILVDTRDEADEIMAELRDGGDFEQIAADRSTDTVSGTAGGDLGCQPRGTYVAEFGDALENAQDGQLFGPVETDFGFHVIRVDRAYRVVPLDDVRDEIVSGFAAANGQGWINYILATTKVTVDPRFGTWDATNFAVIPPEGAQAPTSDALDPTTP